MDIGTELQRVLPARVKEVLDETILEYAVGILESDADEGYSSYTTEDELYDAIGDLLLESDPEENEEEIRASCRALVNVLHPPGQAGDNAEGDGNDAQGGGAASARAKRAQDTTVLVNQVSLSSMLKDTEESLRQLGRTSKSFYSTAEADSGDTMGGYSEEEIRAMAGSSSSSGGAGGSSRKKDAILVRSKRKQLEPGELESILTIPGGCVSVQGKDIKVEGIELTIGGRKLIENGVLMLQSGRRVGLAGRNGAGKSTLLKHIANRDIPIPEDVSILYVAQEADGDEKTAVESVLLADTERTELLAREKELNALSETQGTYSSEKFSSIDKELEYLYSRMNEIEVDSAEARARAILKGLQFTEEMQDKQTQDFSGGWRMRIAIARALFAKPDIFIADEITNHLDYHAYVWLREYMAEWPTTLLIVSHQRDFLNQVCTDILHLHNHELTLYKGNYDQFEETIEDRTTQQKRAYMKQQREREHMMKFVNKFRFNAKRASQAQSRLKALKKMELVEKVMEDAGVIFKFPSPTKVDGPIIRLEDVDFGYEGQEKLFKRVNMTIDQSTRMAIVGANGAGKSTLLKLMVGEEEPVSGNVYRNGKARIGYFNQFFVDGLDMESSPLQLLKDLYPNVELMELRAHLGRFGLNGDLALQPIYELSGGQKSRVLMSKLAYAQPNVLLCDEISNHLDLESVEALTVAFDTFEGGVVLVTHDEFLMAQACEEIWIARQGKVFQFQGDFKDYMRLLENY